MSSKKELYEKLHLLQNSIPKQCWKYYHLDAISNFIYHLDSFSSERTSSRIASSIDNYLSVVQTKMEYNTDYQQTAKELYGKYIWPISDEYRYELGFIGRPYYPLYVIIAIISFFILYFFYSFAFAITTVGIIFILLVVRGMLKDKARKVF